MIFIIESLERPFMKELKKLVILHSNDMHGDFLSKDNQQLVGGVSMLSGYVTQVREEEESVLYCIAGDMLQGSLIDSEFKGISTMEIMNYIAPDIACIGNHEVDYGLPHLLFLEKYAKFPIISANFYLKNQNTRLLNGHRFIEIDGLKVLFIGILTEAILDSLKSDKFISTFIDIKDAASEVGKICDTYRTVDVDLTVLLTHIGFENDCKMAELLNPEWGVDLIIGGHSHTILKEPAKINNILVTQAGVGTAQIGRFDLIVDKETNQIQEYTWELIPINSNTCPKDTVLEHIITRYKDQVDEKYNRILTHLSRKLTHPVRFEETELGNLFSDIGKDMLGLDLMMLGSGAIRKTELGPNVTVADLYTIFPYAEAVHQIKLSGAQLMHIFECILAIEKMDPTFEHYQVNHGTQIIYDGKTRKITCFEINGQALEPSTLYKVGIQTYHLNNLEKFWDIKSSDVVANFKPIILCTSLTNVIEEYLMTHTNLKSKVEGRIQRINTK
jgi:5'-nucleotidase / UDP-sugar diphosphatase